MKRYTFASAILFALVQTTNSGYAADLQESDIFLTPLSDTSFFGGYVGGDGDVINPEQSIDWSIGNTVPFDPIITDDMVFSTCTGDYTNPGDWNERMRITKDGNVGIGTTSPAFPFHLKKANLPGTSVDLTIEATGSHGSGLRINADKANSGAHFRLFSTASSSSQGGGKLIIESGTSGVDFMTFEESSGNVGIGTTHPFYELHVTGDVAATSFVTLSSKTFKEDIQEVDKSENPVMLAKLIDMELTTYKYRKEYGGDGSEKLGFIAEKMPKEVLSKDGKGVDVYKLLTFTIGAMKAQQEEIDSLKIKLQQNTAIEKKAERKEINAFSFSDQ